MKYYELLNLYEAEKYYYHGSNSKNIKNFNLFKQGKRGQTFGKGYYFTPDINLAKSYGKHLYKVKLVFNHPFDFQHITSKDIINISKAVNEIRKTKNKPPIELTDIFDEIQSEKKIYKRGILFRDYIGEPTNILSKAGYDATKIKDEIIVYNKDQIKDITKI